MQALARGALAVTLVLAPELLGGVLPGTLVAIALASAATLALTVYAYRVKEAAPPAPGFVLAGLALLGWTALQAAPLPRGVLGWIAPLADSHLTATARAIGSPLSLGALSLAPGATRTELVKLAAVLAVGLTSAILAARGERRFLLRSAAASGVLMAIIALAHGAFELDTVFGLYAPKHVERRLLLAPLMNENQLGGFLSLTLPVALLLALTAEGGLERLLWWGGVALVTLATALTLSRGTYLSALVGVALLILVVRPGRRGARRQGRRHPAEWLGAAGALGVALALALAVGGEAVGEEASRTDTSKVALAARGLALATDHPWVGVGRGAFASAFASEAGTTKRAMVPENIAAQWLSEWGIPAGGLALGALVWALLRLLRTVDSSSRRAAAVALLAALVHDLFDFTLELLGPAVVASALLAAALTPRQRGGTVDSSPNVRTWRAAPAGVIFATLALFAPGVVARDARALEAELTSAYRAKDRPRFRAVLVDAVRHYPAEPTFALLAAAEATLHRDPAAGRWLNRSMALAPTWAAPHAVAAEALASTGRRDQALLELREAYTRDPVNTRDTLCRWMAGARGFEEVERAAPLSVNRVEYFHAVARCREVPPALRARSDAYILSLDIPTSAKRGALLRTADRAVSEGRAADAVRALSPFASERAEDATFAATLARALLADGDAEGARRAASRARRAAPRDEALLRVIARAEAALGQRESVRATITELRGVSAADPAALSRTLTLLAELELRAGDPHRALAALEEAMGYTPSAATLSKIAAAAEAAHQRGTALEAHRRLCRGDLGASEPAHCAAARRLETPSAPAIP